MPLDPSIGLQAGQGVTPVQNPLAVMGQYQGIANAQAQNKLIQASTDKTNLDVGQSANMAAAQGMGEFMGLPVPMRTQGNARQLMDSLLSKGAITPAAHDASITAINATKNQAELDQIGHLGLLHMMTGPERAAQIYGTAGVQGDGQSLSPGIYSSPMAQTLNGAQNFTQTQSAIQQYPSRGELMSRVPGAPNPDGSPATEPLAAQTPGGLAGPAGGGMGTGRFPGALLNPNNPQTAAPAGTGGASPNGRVTVGQSPAQLNAQSTTGTASAKAFQDITDQGVAARSTSSTLDNMAADAAKSGTGPGQDFRKVAQSIVQRYAPLIAPMLHLDPAVLASNEGLDKLSATLAQGQGSDARTFLTQAANPSSHLSPEGFDRIIKMLRGTADYTQARQTLASTWLNKTDIGGFEEQQGKQLDPRVFQYARMNPAQKSEYMNNMPASTQDAFKKSYDFANGNHLIGGQ